MTQKPTVASFFSGIGGLDLGFQNAGFEVTFQCEIESFCNEILEHHWPNVPRHKNIKDLDYAIIPVSDVWVGGFPCQDVSVARMGPRAGLKGTRSGLFHDFAELLRLGRPGIFVIENVPGLLSSHKGRDFGTLIRTLADIGYCIGWRVLNSKNFGVPQSRSRVYIVGCYQDRRGPVEILFEPECSEGNTSPGESNGKTAISPFKESLGDPVSGPIYQRLAYCLYACSARHTGTDWSRTYVTYPDGRVRRLTPSECEGVQGFPDGWTNPVSTEHDAEPQDYVDSLRYHALGNAVTPPVAKWLGTRIARYLDVRAKQEATVVNMPQTTLKEAEDVASLRKWPGVAARG